jgi:hypothetical protein
LRASFGRRLVLRILYSQAVREKLCAGAKGNAENVRTCDPVELFRMSETALQALTTSANWAIATVVGRRGASLMVAEGVGGISHEEKGMKWCNQTFSDNSECSLGTDKQLRQIESS